MSKTSTDPIADMLTRIRNAILVNKNEVTLPHSKIKESIAKLLKDSNFIDHVDVVELPSVGRLLKILINDENSNAVITEIKRISKPGRRIYASSKEIPHIKKGRGMVVISTSQGIMSGDSARLLNLGGEIICQIY